MKRPRSKIVTVLAALLPVAGAYLLRRRRRPAERVELHFEDGSMVALGEEAPEAARLLALGRELLTAVARPAA